MRFKNIQFVASRSDMYIVSLQQTVCSALSRDFDHGFASLMFPQKAEIVQNYCDFLKTRCSMLCIRLIKSYRFYKLLARGEK